jgi:hypothetical protein
MFIFVRLPSTLILKTIEELYKNWTRRNMLACGLSCVRYGIGTARFTIL